MSNQNLRKTTNKAKREADQLRKAKQQQKAARNRNRAALSYTGPKKKKKKEADPTPKKWKTNALKVFSWVELSVLVGVFIYSIIYHSNLWVVALAIGALRVYWNWVVFTWWYVKVFVLFRKFYADRRKLFKQGTLALHFFHPGTGKEIKKCHRYKTGHIVWKQTPKIAVDTYNKIKKETPKEII